MSLLLCFWNMVTNKDVTLRRVLTVIGLWVVDMAVLITVLKVHTK